MVLSIRTMIILAMVAAAVLFTATSVFAVPGGTRPGWGFGDDNNVHTGPPGQSVHPVK